MAITEIINKSYCCIFKILFPHTILLSEFSQSTYEEGRALVRACKHWGVGLGSPFFIQGGLKKIHLPKSLRQACILHTPGSNPFLWALWVFAEWGRPGHTNPTAEQQWQPLWVSSHSGSPNTTWQPLLPRSAAPEQDLPPPSSPSEAAGSVAEVGSWGACTLQPRQAGPLPVVDSSSVHVGGLCLPVLASAWAPAELWWDKAATALLLCFVTLNY